MAIHHVTEEEFNRLLDQSNAAKEARASKMPDEAAALSQMFEAWLRLKELGWQEAVYCPKDGSIFSAIEAGSTGIHKCNYTGEWPDGHWWLYDGDVWPSRPILWRPRRDDDPEIDLGHAMEYYCQRQPEC